MAMTFNEKSTLFQLQLKARIDGRTIACRVTPSRLKGNQVTITGFSHYRQTDAYIRTTAQQIFGETNVTFDLRILEKGTPRFAIITVPFADIWRNPDDTDPKLRDSQALYGTVVRTYHKEDSYTFVQHPDGYVGYLPTTQLKAVTADQYLQWKNAPHAITRKPIKLGDATLAPGTRLPRNAQGLTLLDGSTLKVSSKDIVESNPADPKYCASLLKHAQEYLTRNTPYLWGGKSELGIDCSGFVQTLNLQQGITLPRDASMQCHVGEIVGYLPRFADLLPGDIMFFMNNDAYVFHVGIYLGNHEYMHSAGATGPTISSVFPKGKNYMSRYGTSFCYARRVKR